MPAKKKSARKAAKKPEKSFEESLWDTATKLRGSVESSDWSGATKTTREGCPQGERGGAHQYKHVVLSLIFLKFVSDNYFSRLGLDRSKLSALIDAFIVQIVSNPYKFTAIS